MNIQSSFTVYTAALHVLILIFSSLHTSGLGYPGLTWLYCISTNKSFSSPKTSSRTPYSNSKQQEKQKHSAENTINFSCCVHARACVRCVGVAFGCPSSPFWAWFGGPVWVCGLCVVAPLLSRLCGSPPPLSGVCWWCVLPLPPLRALFLLSHLRVAWGGVPLVPCPGLPGCGGWGGVLVVGSGPFPWCFPVGGRMLALPVRV